MPKGPASLHQAPSLRQLFCKKKCRGDRACWLAVGWAVAPWSMQRGDVCSAQYRWDPRTSDSVLGRLQFENCTIRKDRMR